MAKRDARSVWRARVRSWERSGLSCREYAEREGLRAASLSWWKWRLKQERPDQASSFVEVEVPAGAGSAAGDALELVAGGVLLRVGPGFCEDTLKRVLGVLEGPR